MKFFSNRTVVVNENGEIVGGVVPMKVDTGAGSGSTSVNQVAEQVLIGPVDEVAPITDTASSGTNGRLQRIAQNLTSLLNLMGVGVATLLKLADTAFASTHAGVMMLTVRRDGAGTPLASVNGRYAPPQTDEFGLLKIAHFDHATGTPLSFTTVVKTPSQFITNLSVAVGLTIPNGATFIFVQCETQDVRYRVDGVDPTASVGMLLKAGDDFQYDGDLTTIKFIEVTASAKLNVMFFA